ncbi:MATE family efflux transporter [Amedibacterium intestinale]|uniref:MATE family efflux transporter n=1 Tax=Amedibacterium intestinale TaxID=2583452 RepID=UPI000E200727
MKQVLTEGNIGKGLILFSLPMIAGNLLQQLYNVVDTLIVGQTIGAQALSAVGSSYALMVLLTSVILGLCMGSGVVFSQLYGANREEEVKVSIVNAFVLIFLVSAVVMVLSYLLLNSIVVWMQIPKEAIVYVKEYLTIIFSGILFVFLYNFFSAILRSVGNTFIPLVFLGVSAFLNIVLDLVFILVFHMGVKGAAWATVSAQVVSAIGVMVYFFLKGKELCPARKHLFYDQNLLHMVIVNSTLTAIQQSIMNFGILMVQGLVNSFGFAVSAAFAVVVKIDAFAYMPAQDFGNAFSTYAAQNYGAEKPERILKGIRIAFITSILFCCLASIVVCLFAKELMLLFVKPEEIEIISIGITYLHIEGAFYAGIGILFLLYGLYRGLGRSMMSIVLTILSLGSRVVLAYTLSAFPILGVNGIWVSVPIGWALADVVGIWYFQKHRKRLLSSMTVL